MEEIPVYRSREKRKQEYTTVGRYHPSKYGRRMRRKRIMRTMTNTHMFKRTAVTVLTINDNFTHHADPFTLNSLPDYAEFTNLFDQYKICAIKQKFIFDKCSADANSVTSSLLPNIYSVLDRDDDTALTAIDDYCQYDTLKMKRINNPFKRYFRPRMATAVYQGAFTGYAQGGNMWVDTGSPGVEYYGHKWGIDATMEGGIGSHLLGTIKIFTTYYIKCRTLK